jgi:aminopeptidase N
MSRLFSLFGRATMFALLCSAHLAQAQFPETTCYHVDAGAHERNRNIDVEYMGLDVRFKPELGEVNGVVLHRFKALQNQLDTVFFDAPGISINKVYLDGKAIAFHSIPSGLVCETHLEGVYGQTHEISIDYQAHPKRGIYFIGWNHDNSDDPRRMTRKQVGPRAKELTTATGYP